MKVSVIGAWNRWLALCDVLASNWNEVLVYSIEPDEITQINAQHTSQKYLNGKKINKNIKVTGNLREVLKFSNYILLAVPSKVIESCLLDIRNIQPSENLFFINVIKWIVNKQTIQQLIKKYFPKNKGIVSLLWPSFAKEVIEKNITCICAVSEIIENASFVQNLFSNNYFRVYSQSDVIWAEFYSALKNAIAIASWIISGLWLWENARAALITLWLKEVNKIWNILWAKEETIYGLTWLWDLILTCSSDLSRNFQAGYKIWKDDNATEFLETNQSTVEWINTIKEIKEISDKYHLELPILDWLYQIIYQWANPSEILRNLMDRPLSSESVI